MTLNPKPGLESLFKNLRPVSNLAYISKLTERAVFNQIYDHLVRSGLYPQLPACRRLLFPLLHAEKGRLRNAVANRVPASCWVPKILRTRCDRLTHSSHCLT